MNWRTKKRMKFLSTIFLPILSLIIFYLAYKYYTRPASCFNNRLDPGEEQVDCGGPCPPCELKFFQPLKKYPVKYLVYPDKTMDLIALAENPNQNLALKKLKYQFLIYDFDDNLKITTNPEETILLPWEKRYLIKIKFPLPDFVIGKVDLKIFDPKKEDFLKTEPEKLPLTFYNEKIFQENNRWKVNLTLFNPKIFPFYNIEVIVLVYNKDNLVAVSKSIVSLNPEETKDIILTLPPLLIEPTGIEVYFQRTSLVK